MSIQSKLLTGFGVVVGLLLVVGVFAVARLGSDHAHLAVLASRVVPSTRAVGDVNALMNKYREDQLHYIAAMPSDRPLGVPGSIAGDLQSDLSSMRRVLRAFEARGLGEDARDTWLLRSFRREFGRYVEITAGFRALADESHGFQASELVGDGAGGRQWGKLKTLIARWSNHKVMTAAVEQQASYLSYRFSVRLIVSLLLAAIGIAVGVAVLLARRTTRAVREIGAAAKAISQGDINQRVGVHSRDELGELAGDFDGMIGYLKSTVAIAEAIAEGHLDVGVWPRSESDALGNALVMMTASLRRLVGDNERLLATSREEAHSDSLTLLPNRRAFMRDLEARIAEASDEWPLLLGIFDLDGFKTYNDTFGHAAGDALLVRLGARLEVALEGTATAYRIGGDEFCVLASCDGNAQEAIARTAAAALSEQGEAFKVGCSYGVASLPREASTAEDALRLADKRMYDLKTGRSSASRQSTDVLLKALDERSPGLGTHINAVADHAATVARTLGLPEHEVKRVELAAELHDIGKVAIPESILDKPGPLTPDEWAYIRRHTEIGERIVAAAPSLAATAELIRASHERYDGTGYPDQLRQDEIPLGARIIAICDAYDAMTSTRAYSPHITHAAALAEIRRCAGTQFDPMIVDTFCRAICGPSIDEAAA